MTLKVQLAPAASDEPQLFVWVKSPPTCRSVSGDEALPLFVKVTVSGELTLCIRVGGNVRGLGVKVRTGLVTAKPSTPTLARFPDP